MLEQRKRILGAALAALTLIVAGGVSAQGYPTRAITFIDNIPGGAQEAAKRAILAKVKDNTGATIIYEARPGGGGAPGLQALKNASPDGYTFGGTYASAINLGPLINADLGIDPLRDYVAITNLWSSGNVWTGRADHPARDLRDLVATAKAKPESVKVGVFGAGNKFFMAQLEEKTGAKFLQVPFKTLGESLAAILGGQVDATFDSPGTPIGQKGKLKIFLYGINPRLPQFPDTPTTLEMYGLETGSWTGFFAPAKTSPEHVNWLSREIVRAIKDPAIAKIVTDQTLVIIASTPSDFAAQMKKEVEENRGLVKKYPDIK
jgi:tripartite-type tricarboxylate transporter receptor subunit TctC